MKECCKTGDEPPESNIKIWAKRIIWGIVILIVMGLVTKEIINL
jgi:hypothetical protein